MLVKDLAALAASSYSLDPKLVDNVWVNHRFQEWGTVGYQKPFRRVLQLVIPGRLSTGTISVTQGSKTVTPNAAAIVAWDAANSIIGRFIRGKNNWYEIVDYNGTTATLKTVWTEDTNTASSYNIVPRRVTIEEDIRKFGTFVNLRSGQPLTQRALDYIDHVAARRSDVASNPSVWAEVAADEEGKKIVEFYPYANEDFFIGYTAYVKPPELSSESVIPDYVDAYALLEGVKVNILERKMSEAYNAGNTDLGNSIGNQAARQRTIWKDAKKEMIMNAEASNDAAFVLSVLKDNAFFEGDITNARDQIRSGWSSLT